MESNHHHHGCGCAQGSHGCGCEHHHEHHHHEHGSLGKRLLLISVTVLLLIGAYFVEKTCALSTWQLLLVYLVPYLLIGHDTLGEAAEGIAHADVFNEHFLMTIATIGALCIGFFPGEETEFAEAVFVMLFFQVGELFEGYAEGKSHDSISHLMTIRPDVAHVCHGEEVETVAPETVQIGETVLIKRGEKVPLDGKVVSGSALLDTSVLTGESVPREVKEGDEVYSGSINVKGELRLQTIKTFGESTASRIIALVEGADASKSRSESFITRFARIYTPVVVLAALVLAIVPPLLGTLGLGVQLFGEGGFMQLLLYGSTVRLSSLWYPVLVPWLSVCRSLSSVALAEPPAQVFSSREAVIWMPLPRWA